MKIAAHIQHSHGEHQVTVSTDGTVHSLAIPSRESGYGSRTNGGELLFLALATCYCNDIYREAAKRDITVDQVEVEVEGQFGAIGEPAREIRYRATVVAQAEVSVIEELMRHTDTVSEIQNTLRLGMPVVLGEIAAISSLG